jgi:hypothetical protein
MRVFTFSQWLHEHDVFACQTCDEEKGVMYVLADKWEDVEGLIDTENGQQCAECLAQMLTEWPFNREGTTRHWNVTLGNKQEEA